MYRLVAICALGASLCAQSASEYDALKLKARQALTDGKSAAALEIMKPLARKAPDDIDAQYLLAKSYRLTGNLDAAEKTTQWMLDLRPEFPGGLYEAALLREQFKDYTGAVDLLNTVFRATAAAKHAERLEILNDVARVLDKLNLASDAAQVRKEMERLKGLIAQNAKATSTPDHP